MTCYRDAMAPVTARSSAHDVPSRPVANVMRRRSAVRSDLVAGVREWGRKIAEHTRAAVDLLVHAIDVERVRHPNSRRFIASHGAADTPEAQASRVASRAWISRAEAGDAVDTTEYLRKRIEELRHP